MERIAATAACACVALWACPGSGCAASGTDQYAALSEYVPETGEYRVRYLAPPWQVSRSEGTEFLIFVEGNLATVIESEKLPAKYALLVSVEPGDAEQRANDDAKNASAMAQSLIRSPAPISVASGDTGWELLTRSILPDARWFRNIYFDLDASNVVRLAFVAFPNLDNAEVNAMLQAFELHPEP